LIQKLDFHGHSRKTVAMNEIIKQLSSLGLKGDPVWSQVLWMLMCLSESPLSTNYEPLSNSKDPLSNINESLGSWGSFLEPVLVKLKQDTFKGEHWNMECPSDSTLSDWENDEIDSVSFGLNNNVPLSSTANPSSVEAFAATQYWTDGYNFGKEYSNTNYDKNVPVTLCNYETYVGPSLETHLHAQQSSFYRQPLNKYVKEVDLVRECHFMLSGLESVVFDWDPTNEMFLVYYALTKFNGSLVLKHLTVSSLSSIMKSLAECGTVFKRLTRISLQYFIY
jgi:hypothetical protein